MYNDGLSFALVCVVTRGTLPVTLDPWIRGAMGAALIAIGVGMKTWAARTVSEGTYYWRNFFDPAETPPLKSLGPYRYLRNPMYTVGNVHMYGIALVTGSWYGFLAAAFDQAAIMIFHVLVEKPHFERLTRRAALR